MRHEPDSSEKVSRTWSLLTEQYQTADETREVGGIVYTPLGIVNVYQAVPDRNEHATISYATFVWKGRRHLRYFRKASTSRGLAILAGRFARDVAAGRLRR